MISEIISDIVIISMESSSVESVYDSEEEGNIYETVHDIPDDVTVYEDVDTDDSDQAEREKCFRDMKSIIDNGPNVRTLHNKTIRSTILIKIRK